MEQGSFSGHLEGSPLTLGLSFPICKVGVPCSFKYREFRLMSHVLWESFSDPAG